MDINEFRKAGHDMVEFIANYLETVDSRPVLSQVQPGYLKDLIPDHAPEEGEAWEAITADIERVIMPGVTHWQSTHFHAYFPANMTFPALLGDMLSGAIGCIGFSWICSPACTELETIVLDWLGRAIGLPESFLSRSTDGTSGKGGGVIQGTASEAVLVTMLAARTHAADAIVAKDPTQDVRGCVGRLVAYASDQVHSSVEKACLIAGVRFHAIEADADLRMTGELLEAAMREDVAKGLVPFFVCATLGSTNSCAVDDIPSVGAVCRAHELWFHVDAAYSGSALVCPEYRHTAVGVELADSFNFNPHKGLLVNFDCSTLWIKDRYALVQGFTVNPEYLKNAASESGLVTDYRHWQIPLGRRFRSLKLWFVMRTYGIKGMQSHIREHVRLASVFETLIRKDDRFELPTPPTLGLVCFRVKGSNDLNRRLLDSINGSAKLYMVHTVLKGSFIIRFVVGSIRTTDDDVVYAWNLITEHATRLLAESNSTPQ